MADVIHHERVEHDRGSGMGFLLGTLLVVALLALLFFGGIPLLRGGSQTINQNNTPSQGTTPDVNISVPDKP